MREAVARSLWRQKRQAPDEWGAENRVYGAKTGWPGRRNPNLTPYSIEFSRQFYGGKYKLVVMVTSAQTGKTETFLDIIGERLDNRPMPIIYVGPSKEFVRDQFEPRLVELFRQSTSLGRKVLGGVDSKKQTKTLKRVNGTRIRLAHAGSSTALKSDPAAFALVDEYDEMIANVKGQGDPLGLVQARGDTYSDFVAGIVSTPSKGMVEIERDDKSGLEFWKKSDSESVKSPIWRLWQEGTRHHWVWQCPHCKDWFVPRFNLMHWPKGASPSQAKREAYLRCPTNGCVVEDRHKKAMNDSGRHVAPGQLIDIDGNVTGEPPESTTLSFWISGLASPFVSFGERVEKYLAALKTNESAKVQTALNSQFGEVYVDGAGDVPAWEAVYEARDMSYQLGTAPEGVRYLTFGCDVQKDRLIYVTRGWGARGTSWLVDRGELLGRTASEDVWQRLSEYLREPIDGHLIKVGLVDSGFRPGKREGVPVNRVYEFCRRHRRFVWPSKGSSHKMLRVLVRSSIEVKPDDGKALPYGLELIRLDTDHWKQFVHEHLVWPQDQPGAWFYPEDVGEDYCRQLVAEARVVNEIGKPQWIARSRENHYLDAEAMAAAAGFMLNVQHLRGLGDRPRPKAREDGEAADAMPPPPKPTPLAPPAVAAVRKSRAERYAEISARQNQ